MTHHLSGTAVLRVVKVLLLTALSLASLALGVSPVLAEPPGTSATATAHARDELANASAQGKITRTPTLSATATLPPTATPTPTPVPPIETPTPTPAPEPCWLTDQDLGDPDGGFVVFDKDGAPVPCLPEDQPLPSEDPTPEPEPRAVNAAPPAIARPAPAPVPVASQPVAAVAQPTYTLQPTYTPLPTYTPAPTPQSSATGTPVVQSVAIVIGLPPTSTPTVQPSPTLVAPVAGATAVPLEVDLPAKEPLDLGWLRNLLIVVLFGIVTVVLIVRRRSIATWRERPNA